MKSISTRVNRSIQRPVAQPAPIAPVIEGQWRERKATTKPTVIKVPFTAWAVLVSSILFQVSLFSVVTSRLAIEDAIWFFGGVVVGMLFATVIVGLFCYLVYSANRNS